MLIYKNSDGIKRHEYYGGHWYDYEKKIDTDEDIIIDLDKDICFEYGVSTKGKIKSNVTISSDKHIIAGCGIEADGDIEAEDFIWADGDIVKATGNIYARYFDINCGIEVGGYIAGGAEYHTYDWSFSDDFPRRKKR